MGVNGIVNINWMSQRTRARRGGQERRKDNPWDRSTPDAMALWRDDYLRNLRARNYAQDTLTNRERILNFFMLWAAQRELTRATQITRPILEAYQLGLSKYTKANGKRLSWRTQGNMLTCLKGWFRWMTRQNVIMHNPASELEMPRAEHRLPTAGLSLSQMAALLAVPNVADPLGIRDRAMLEVFYSCGLRRTELCRLEVTDFSAERRTLLVRQGKGHKDRMVPVGEQAVEWIEKYLLIVRPRLCLDTRTQALFLTCYGGPFNPDVVSRMMASWMKEAGLQGLGCCHLLRHTCATHMLEGGADIRFIQQLLGHANLETTSIYTQVSIRQLQDVHARCHPSGRLANVTKSASQ
jgi:integrase/recombinase XerD